MSETARPDVKRTALQAAIAQIEKQFGRGAIMRLGAEPKQLVNGISTGSLTLDLALGGGGIPRARVSEIFGPEASGKTTVCLHIAANAQKNGGTAAFIDAEHALDPVYAKRIGVNVESLLLSQPDNGEQALEIADLLVRSGSVDLIVIDSVAALAPRAEIEGEMGDAHVGLQARLMSQALRKLTGSLGKSNTAIVFTNQIREKIGVMYGNPETTPGGRALKFYASVRIETRRITSIKDGEAVIGNRSKATIVKNKLAPPFRKAEFDIIFGKGISREGDVLELGELHKVLTKSGTWFNFGETRLGQGRDKAREYLEQNAEVMKQIEEAVKKAAATPGSPGTRVEP
ncbi:MAG: recombination protein [Planctomycetota bacterium]|nr:MAG: recombination protein [Planctomycetota bacterium]